MQILRWKLLSSIEIRTHDFPTHFYLLGSHSFPTRFGHFRGFTRSVRSKPTGSRWYNNKTKKIQLLGISSYVTGGQPSTTTPVAHWTYFLKLYGSNTSAVSWMAPVRFSQSYSSWQGQDLHRSVNVWTLKLSYFRSFVRFFVVVGWPWAAWSRLRTWRTWFFCLTTRSGPSPFWTSRSSPESWTPTPTSSSQLSWVTFASHAWMLCEAQFPIHVDA